MTTNRRRLATAVLNHTTLLLFAVVFATFGVISPVFFTWSNLANLLVQASSTTIIGVGMTFVLLTAGVDLSVGAIMFVAAAIAGSLALGGVSFHAALAVIVAVGLAGGAVNALLVTRLGIPAFVATLGTLFIGRGLGLWITRTRAMNLPESYLELGSASVAGIPLPILVTALVVATGHAVLTRTQYGRRIYAIGHDVDAARRAGLDVRRLLFSVYVVSGGCAALGGILSLAQLGAVSPTFGTNREFAAIAAAVLGGTSLFGGRGGVFPGTVLGAVLIQSVESGLVVMNADPYLYPLVTSAVIFVAVLLDSTRTRLLARWNRRRIYVE
jgi:ribose transport system permease protein